MSTNPLANYYRRPAIYINLPSGGKNYPEGAIEMPENGEIPVYPMTAFDEITYQTPDALFNGTAIPSVIKSCVPCITDPWVIPNNDLTAILIAIRIASNGNTMGVTSTCPSCKSSADYEFDLRSFLDSVPGDNNDSSSVIGGLRITFRSLSYRDMNKNSQISFEEQKLNQALREHEDLPEDERIRIMTEAFLKVSKFTIETLIKNIASIETEETVVTDPKHIEDFIRNCDRTLYSEIKSFIVKQRQSQELKPLSIKCSDCEHEYTQPFTINMSDFFG